MSGMAAVKLAALGALVASATYVHLRGRARHSFLRQLTDHSTFFAPVNALVYLASAVPSRPFLELRDFPALAPRTAGSAIASCAPPGAATSGTSASAR